MIASLAHAGAPPSRPDPKRASLWRIASTALASNRVQVGARSMLIAGRYQFGSMWTRDFAFASRGLLAMGDQKTVRDHLDTIFEHVNHDGLTPRGLDTIPIGRRVVVGMIRGRLGMGPSKPQRNGKLRAQFLDEHGSPSLDSNLLVIKTALDYAKGSHDSAWLTSHKGEIAHLFHYYKRYTDKSDGLIVQPKFSDWQDSVKREGKSFYVNLLHVAVAKQLGKESGYSPAQLDKMEAGLKKAFYDPKSGLYKSLLGEDYVSLDGNLLALDLGLVKADSQEGKALYAALKKSPLWTRGDVPGSTTVGDYPKSWLHIPARIAGLSHYHDELHWSWLTAMSAKVADQMGDHAESRRIIDKLSDMATRDGSIAEIYAQKKRGVVPFKSLLYKSEAPFSWGASIVLDALHSTQPKQ